MTQINTDQLKLVNVWQPKRVYFNTSWWFYGSKEKFEKASESNLIQLKTGVYYQSVGKSNQEIAALSRSKHESQGFGSTGTRGEEQEYLELLKGDLSKDNSNIFEGIDTSWNRVKGGKIIGDLLQNVEGNFNFKNPSASIPDLVKAYAMIQQLEDEQWKALKSEEIKKIIAGCAGLYLEAVSSTQEIVSNSIMKVKLEAINRSAINMKLASIKNAMSGEVVAKEIELKTNSNQSIDF